MVQIVSRNDVAAWRKTHENAGIDSAVCSHCRDRHYADGADGRLYEVSVSTDPPAIKSVKLGDASLFAVGSPALDWPNKIIHVGSEPGVFYAVQVPLP